MTQEIIYHDPRLTQFYDADCGWSPDRQYCLEMAMDCSSVLDLGCGTGSLALAIARSHDCTVVGVDPARAMLDEARRHGDAGKVTWIEADAREVVIGRAFDLIVMTGHAFQCLLTPQDQAAVLTTIRKHLSPQGRFIFDSRNPLREEWREWAPSTSMRHFVHPAHGDVRAWNDVSYEFETSVATYGSFYEIMSSGELLQAPASRIAFPSKEALAALLNRAGLLVDSWLGDWTGGAFDPGSVEIIPVGRRAF